jgi:hypothetical protein
LSESFSKYLKSAEYYKDLNKEELKKLEEKYKEPIQDKVSKTIVASIGKPIYEFMQYLENNYSRHCVPSDIVSGLSNLPLDKVWLDQKETNETTTKKLPTGEMLDGKKSYEMILPYFTTSKRYDSATVYALGVQQVDKLYKQAEIIAKEITGKTETPEAVSEFKYDLTLPKHFFNTSSIPIMKMEKKVG